MKKSANFQYGYYVFLGLGDYHQPQSINKNWVATWGLKEWIIFLKKLVKLKANTLMIYLNGHLLPYESNFYPELTDWNHPNVKNEFFSEVLGLASKYELNTIMVLTTTGHAANFLKKHPDLSIKIRSKNINLDKLLSPFPDHIRKTKNLAQSGAAQIGLGTLCHNNLKSQEYAINIINECLNIYPQINGIALHPPESIYPCFCGYCCKLFDIKYTKNLLTVSDKLAREFYLETYLNFQKNYLENAVRILLPNIQFYSFTVPWLFEESFAKMANNISKETIIIDWDYNLNTSRINQLNKRLLDYQLQNYRVWFMPTAGFGLGENGDIKNQIAQVKKQMQIALDSSVSGIIHFVGPSVAIDLKKTNFYHLRVSKMLKCQT